MRSAAWLGTIRVPHLSAFLKELVKADTGGSHGRTP